MSSNQLYEQGSRATNDDLEDWISKASQGDREFQKRIYDLLAAKSYRVIRRIVGESDAEDVMQDFVIHLFSKLRQFRFESSFETWAHRMAVNQSLQHLRKIHRDEKRIHNVAASMDTSTTSDEDCSDEDAELLENAMSQIPGEQRALLHMKEVEGLGYSAIARVLGIPEGTVGSRLNKARSSLKNTLIKLGWEG